MPAPKTPSFHQFSFPLFPIIVLSIAFVLLIFSISPYYQRQEPIFPSYQPQAPIPTPRYISPMPTSINQSYTCPASEWVDCMPIVPQERAYQCQAPYLQWAKTNCPGFQGAAL